MPRPKRSSTALDKAERRLSGLKSIDAVLDLGNGLSVRTYNELITEMRTKLETYNMALSSVDAAYSAMLATEQSLRDLSEHMLLGVASKYGKNSYEYEMAGGVRKSDRKRPTRKPKTEAVSI